MVCHIYCKQPNIYFNNSGNSQDIRDGEIITVYYEPDNPSRIWRNPKPGRNAAGIIALCLVAAVILGITIYGIAYKKKHGTLSAASATTETGNDYINPYSEQSPEDNNQSDIYKF